MGDSVAPLLGERPLMGLLGDSVLAIANLLIRLGRLAGVWVNSLGDLSDPPTSLDATPAPGTALLCRGVPGVPFAQTSFWSNQ